MSVALDLPCAEKTYLRHPYDEDMAQGHLDAARSYPHHLCDAWEVRRHACAGAVNHRLCYRKYLRRPWDAHGEMVEHVLAVRQNPGSPVNAPIQTQSCL